MRSDYDVLVEEFPVPWNQLDESDEFFSSQPPSNTESDISDSPGKKLQLAKIRVSHDPLAQDTKTAENSDLRTLESLIADVNRLFPQLPDYFIASQHNRKLLIEILFRWWKLNGGSYYQGLHELAGIIFIVLNAELIDKSRLDRDEQLENLDMDIAELMDHRFLSHDVFSMFNRLMAVIIDKYYDETSLLQETIKFDLKLRLVDKFQYHLFKNKLRLDSAIWLIRYFRLLLIREIGLLNSFELWDKMLAFGHFNGEEQTDLSLLLPYVTILLISKIKARLMISDYGEALFLLLHYPINDSSKVKVPAFSAAILVNDDIDSPTDELDFTYIEENHHSHSLSLELEPEQDPDLVEIDIPQLALDAMTLFDLSDQDLAVQGSKLIESYSGLLNEEDRRGVLSASPIKKSRSSSPFLGDILKRSASWGKNASNSSDPTTTNNSKTTLDFSKLSIGTKLEPPALKSHDGLNKGGGSKLKLRDFDRTRLEMRLQKKVSDALKK